MRALVSAVIVMVVAHVASAQPGQAPAPYPPPPPQPYPPQPYPPPPQPQQPVYVPIQLTADEQALLAQGEISDGATVGGAAANLLVGFGLGQAIQGRWGDTGWIFTLGEAGSITALFVGIAKDLECIDSCANSDAGTPLLVAGLVGYLVFHAWSIVDAISGPSNHNRKVRELRMRLGLPQPMYTQRIVPYVHKSHDGASVAGLTFRF